MWLMTLPCSPWPRIYLVSSVHLYVYNVLIIYERPISAADLNVWGKPRGMPQTEGIWNEIYVRRGVSLYMMSQYFDS